MPLGPAFAGPSVSLAVFISHLLLHFTRETLFILQDSISASPVVGGPSLPHSELPHPFFSSSPFQSPWAGTVSACGSPPPEWELLESGTLSELDLGLQHRPTWNLTYRRPGEMLVE